MRIQNHVRDLTGGAEPFDCQVSRFLEKAIMISFNTDDAKMPRFGHREVSKWIKAVAAEYGCKTGEIAYIFCSDNRILEVNREYLGHDYFTDIITFDYTDGSTIAGDIFISLDTVRRNAGEYKVSFVQELMRVMIHGILHLTGQGDKTDAEFEEMKKKEDKALGML